jgi:hypothetical protein
MLMFANDLALFQAMCGYSRRLVADLNESEMDRQPAPGMNTPRWILAHLAICNDYTAAFFGDETKLCPEEWHAAFGPRSQPNDPAAPKPPLVELMAQIDAGEKRVVRVASAGMPAEAADRPNPFESLRAAFPTVGVFVAHLLTTHPAVHLGQFSAWRRVLGKPPV